MSVNPGFGGQSFIPEVLSKLQQLRTMRDEKSLGYEIEIDGGINAQTALLAVQAGANALVAGSAIFHTADYAQAIAALRAVASGDQSLNNNEIDAIVYTTSVCDK